MNGSFKATLAILGGILLFLGVIFGLVLVVMKKCSSCHKPHYMEEDDLWDEEWDEEDWRVSEKNEDDIPF